MAIDFPNINPVILHIGLLDIRWYALAYIFGILLAWYGFRKTHDFNMSDEALDSVLSYTILGIIIGARMGEVIFYDFYWYINHPFEIVKIWHGGMSFHGGMLGLIIALYVCCKKYNLPTLKVLDLAACFAPIGLFLGRITNFINSELWGKVTDVPWAVIFPNAGPLPRHPSQIYEALCEGLILFSIMMFLLFKTELRYKSGFLASIMIILYAFFRIIIEFFREPDSHIGYLIFGLTLGQILSIPMIICGLMAIYILQNLRVKS